MGVLDDAVLGYAYDQGADRARFTHRYPLDSDLYRSQKERFVTGSAGSTPTEVALICLITTASLIVHDVLCSRLGLRSPVARFVAEFTLVPVVMIVAIFYPEHALSIFIAQISAVVTAVVLSRGSILTQQAGPATLADSRRLRFVTWVRSAFMLCTCVCILAVDFPLFPRRSIKTETFGVSLMDTGVGFVVFSGGVVSRQARSGPPSNVWRAISGALPVLVLGVIRLVSVRAVDYQTHVSEYGLHWNFFLTLGAVALLSQLADPLVRRASAGAMAVGTAVLAQALISANAEFLLNADRSTLFAANREGVFSSLGYVSIYLAGIQVGQRIGQAKSTRTWWRLLGDLMGVAVSGFAIIAIVGPGAVSRRFANLPFVVWVVALNAAVLALVLAYDLVAARVPPPDGSIVLGVDRNQLVIFLLGNLTTGAINLSMQTVYADSHQALTTVTLYVLMISAVAALLDRARISLKFW